MYNDSVATYSPILVKEITVNNGVSWKVTSTHNASSPFGTNAEIVIRPEIHFIYGSEVRLTVNVE